MLTKEFKAEHAEIDWASIEGMRHVLVHGYYTIEPIIVVRTIENDLPKFKKQIQNLMDTL